MGVNDKFLELNFPENMVRRYRFKGYDLKSESVLQHLEMVNDALNEYYQVLWKEKENFKKVPKSQEFHDIKNEISTVIDIQQTIVLSLQQENKKKQSFMVRMSSGEEVVVNYATSWENVGLIPKKINTLEQIFLVFLPKIYAQYIEKRNNYYDAKIRKNPTYMKYHQELNIKDKKILAYKLLNEISPIWQANETLELIALHMDIEIVKARDFEDDLFADRRKNIASNQQVYKEIM